MSSEATLMQQMEAAGLVVVHKKDLEEIFLKVQAKSRVDNRVKWIKKAEVKALFNVSEWQMRAWRSKVEQDPESCLVRFKQVGGATSAFVYNKKSIEDELYK